MSISDELMWKYYTLLTDLRASEIDAMRDEVSHGGLHPMKAKKDLAWGIVRDFHSAAEADAAAESWAKQFQQRAVSEDIPTVQLTPASVGALPMEDRMDGFMVRMPKLLQLAGLASSAGEATRKLGENAVSVNGEKFNGTLLKSVNRDESIVLRLGKRSVRVEWVR
jgi:tyrosyl-tRNA synthetase